MKKRKPVKRKPSYRTLAERLKSNESVLAHWRHLASVWQSRYKLLKEKIREA